MFLLRIQESTNLTPDEIIADLAGAKIAYESYKILNYLNGEEPILPGIKYNSEQLYWISLILSECSTTTFDTEATISYKNNILVNKLRVFTLLMNLEDFTKDFDCSLNSYINHGQKCEVW